MRKKLLKNIILSLMAVILFNVFSLQTDATTVGEQPPTGDGTGSPDGNGEGGGEGGGTGTVSGGPLAVSRTGYMLYMVDSAGNAVSPDAKFVLTSPTGEVSIGANYTKDTVSRLGGYDVSFDNIWGINAPWGAPWEGNFVGRGSQIKQWFITKNEINYNVESIITQYWGQSLCDAFIETDNGYYLIIEPIYWNQIYINNVAQGIWEMGTARGIGAIQQSLESQGLNPYGSGNISSGTNKAYAQCCRFQFTQLGLEYGIQHSYVTNTEMQQYAYGIMSIWAGDLTDWDEDDDDGDGDEPGDGDDWTPPGDPDDDEMEIVKFRKQLGDTGNIIPGNYNVLNGLRCAPVINTYNTCSEFDLGVKIPTTETYVNNIKETSWFGQAIIQRKTETDTSTVPYVYSWQETTTETGRGTTLPSNATQTGYDEETGIYTYTYPVTTTYEQSGNFTYTQRATFYRLKNADFFELTSSDVEENQFQPTRAGQSYADLDTIDLTEKDPYMHNIAVPYSATVQGTTFTTGSNMRYIPTYNKNSYVTFRDISETAITASTVYTNSEDAFNDVYNQFLSRVATVATSGETTTITYSYPTATNDSFSIDGNTYLDNSGTATNNATISDDKLSITVTTVNPLIGTTIDGYGFLSGRVYDIPEEEDDWTNESQNVTIPEETANGEYYTKLTATYKRIVKGSGSYDFTLDDGKNTKTRTNKPAILEGYETNEPIVVHSPAISPAHIEMPDGTSISGDTQLYPGMEVNDVVQLRLDGTYKIEFDWKEYFTAKGYTEDQTEGFTQYLEEKQIRFPFSIKYNGIYYEPTEDMGYTEWITLGKETTEMEFYIPTWAIENVYLTYEDFSANNFEGQELPVQIRVFANNANTAPFDNNLIHFEYNPELSMYGASFEISVQVSGIIYDIQAVAVQDVMNFTDMIEEKTPIDWFHMATYKQERNTGVYNRLGTRSVRYTKDGEITNNWNPKYTLPFASGKSDVTTKGYFEQGTGFSFTVKTIANLYNKNDLLHITPKFSRYLYKDSSGNMQTIQNPIVYYEQNGAYLIQYGSGNDINNHTYSPTEQGMTVYCTLDGNINSLASSFKDAYFDYDMTEATSLSVNNYKQIPVIYNTIMNTARRKSAYMYDYIPDSWTSDNWTLAYNDIMFKKVSIGTVSDITLPSDMRLYTANEEELAENMSSNPNSTPRYNGSGDNLTAEQYESFGKSMQTWYGYYFIPRNMKVLLQKEFITEYNRYYGTSLDVNKTYTPAEIDNKVHQYAADRGITGNENFWTNSGYIVLNFDNIYTKKDGKGHLVYYGGESNMWRQEVLGNPNGTPYSDGSLGRVDLDGVVELDDVPYYEGDIAFISLDESAYGNWEVGIIYLN